MVPIVNPNMRQLPAIIIDVLILKNVGFVVIYEEVTNTEITIVAHLVTFGDKVKIKVGCCGWFAINGFGIIF
jgi:hypothetical protein